VFYACTGCHHHNAGVEDVKRFIINIVTKPEARVDGPLVNVDDAHNAVADAYRNGYLAGYEDAEDFDPAAARARVEGLVEKWMHKQHDVAKETPPEDDGRNDPPADGTGDVKLIGGTVTPDKGGENDGCL